MHILKGGAHIIVEKDTKCHQGNLTVWKARSDRFHQESGGSSGVDFWIEKQAKKGALIVPNSKSDLFITIIIIILFYLTLLLIVKDKIIEVNKYNSIDNTRY